jgi:5'(3')-deoxyribonucleotidase
MDGVIADFTTAYLELVNSRLKHDDIKDWKIFLHTDQTENEFWKTLDLAGEGYWTNIPLYPESISLVEKLRLFDNVTILTSVSPLAPIAAIGKIKWLQKYITPMIPICIDTDKWKYANPKTILIDDKPENVREFINNGGNAYLYSRPWNVEVKDLPIYNYQLFNK